MKKAFLPCAPLGALLPVVSYSLYTHVHTRAVGQVPAIQWTFNGHSNTPGRENVDWVYSILLTERKEYLVVGYSNWNAGPNHTGEYCPVAFKLDKLGRMVWLKNVTQASDANGGNAYFVGNGTSAYQQVIKSPNGYLAVGFAKSKTSSGTPNGERVIITEFDEDGNILHNGLYNYNNSVSFRGMTIAMNAAQTKMYIGGYVIDTDYAPTQTILPFVAQIDYATKALNWTHTFTHPANPNGARSTVHKILVHPTTGDVYATGYLSSSGDNTTQTILNGSDSPTTLYKYNKDIFLLSLTPGATTASQNYLATYDKGSLNYPGSLRYTEYGPFTARTMANDPNPNTHPSLNGNTHTEAAWYLQADLNEDERAYDMIFTQDGNIAITGLVNMVFAHSFFFENGSNLVTNGTYNGDGLIDGTRNNYMLDDYSDGDCYLLKVAPANSGALIWSKNVAHMSSKDFYPRLFQNGRGNYIVSGSTADYNTEPLYPTPWTYDGLVLETPDAPASGAAKDHIWIRTVKGGWNNQADYTNKSFPGQESNMCAFALAPTADGGIIMGGDNTPYKPGTWMPEKDIDHFSVSKLAPYCTDTNSLAINDPHYAITGNVSWPSTAVPNGAAIAGRVIVEAGATLTISNATLRFLSSDHYHDFFHYPEWIDDTARQQMSGILIKPGGKLVIQNSTLKGMDDCQSANPQDRFMWDGIVVEGQNTLAQTYANQGVLEMTNSTIEDARYGTAVDYAYRHRMAQTQSYSDYSGITGSSRYDLDGGRGGGIVKATSTTWKNCRFPVNYQRFTGTPYLFGNRYEKCSFLATPDGMADPCMYASSTGSRLPSATFFSAWDAQRITLLGNNFFCDPGFPAGQRSTGITGTDASYYIGPSGPTGNSFKNLNTGILLTMTPGQNSRYNNIFGNVFENNNAGIDVANSMNGLTISKNEFYIPVANANLYGNTGIRLQTSTGYNVSQNEFDRMGGTGQGNIGIQVSWGKSYVNADNTIRNNSFDHLSYASVGLQINSSADNKQGLQWRCNDYLSGSGTAINRLSGAYIAIPGFPVIIPVPATLRENQGDCNAGSPQPAENRFYTNCSANLRLNADNYVTQAVNYFYDANPSYPELNPACYNSAYTATVCNTTQTPSVACDLTLPDVRDDDDAAARRSSVATRKAEQEAGTDEWYALQTEEHLLVSSACRYYAKVSQPDSAADLMMAYQRPMEALPFYMEARNWAGAETAWNALPSSTEEESQYRQLMRTAIDLYSIGQSWKDASAATISSLLAISGDNTWPGSLALVTTGLLGIKDYQWPTAAAASGTGNLARKSSGNSSNAAIVINAERGSSLKIYPNPTSGSLTIESAKGGEAVLYSLTGAKLWQQTIYSGKSSVQLPRSLAAGTYLVRFSGTDGAVSQTRLVYKP